MVQLSQVLACPHGLKTKISFLGLQQMTQSSSFNLLAFGGLSSFSTPMFSRIFLANIIQLNGLSSVRRQKLGIFQALEIMILGAS